MAIAFVQEVLNDHTHANPGATATLTVVNAPTAGNLLVLSVSMNTSSFTVSSVTDSKGNTWSVDKTATHPTTSLAINIASTVQDVGALTTSDTITLHFSGTFSTGRYTATVHEFSGCTNTVDQTATATATGTSRNAGTTTATTNANDLVWGAFTDGGTDTNFTAGATYSTPTPAFYTNSVNSLMFEYKIVSATGTQNPTGTGTVSAKNIGATVVYEASTGGTPVNNTLTASPGSIAITGSPITPPVARNVPASPGAMSITGFAATPKVGRKVTASPGAMSVTGFAVTPKVARKLALSPGSVVISGLPVTFQAPGAIAYTLVASAGSVAITGSPVTLPVKRKLVASPGSVAITGSSVTTPVKRFLSASPGSMTISGAAVTFIAPGATVQVIDNIQRPYGSTWMNPF